MTRPSLPRIVSLVPSHSEALAAIGARLVGVTRFCTVLPGVDQGTIARVGGTKDPDVGRIVALAPDLVVVNREENRIEDVSELKGLGLKIHVTHPRTVREGIEVLRDLGEVAGRAGEAERLAGDLNAGLERLLQERSPLARVFVPIWRHATGRYMSVNADTYAHDVVSVAGGVNVTASADTRFPDVSLDEVSEAGVDIALLGDEPYHFAERHLAEFESAGIRAACCSGEDLHWYGPRSVEGVSRIRSKLREVVSEAHPA